jgi:cell wall-associated NlpC family hydrolase
MPVQGRSVAYAAAGFVLVYSGWANRSVKDTLTGLLSGHPPAASPAGAPTIGINDTGAAAGSSPANANASTPSGIANDALRYVGHPYVYGGAPGPAGTSGWDCSSFANWVLGHDLHMTLPGSSGPGYNGASHGPTTLSYLAWTGAATIGNSASAAQAGDLLVWQTHMGFALGGGQMISALNESLGTKVTTIAGGSPGPEILFVRRIKGATTSLTQLPAGVTP